MNERLVPRYPTAQASQADAHCAGPAAPAALSPHAGAAFHRFTETRPSTAISDGQAAPETERASSVPGAVALSITLSPAVALILKLATDAAGVDHHEVIARAICVYADRIGIPSLARPAVADDIGDDIGDVPQFVRRDQMRFSRAREALGNGTQGMRK